ncbi:hypothetical protein HG536_0A06380 [Torulaspora globosa]|uniref:Uncharacterized protein n=1 Tax=Torulaspora globosa TaxID=48254 RepID=A0A7G3ZBD7_9SACH|nr:uncharacterized protein HG536_0A06380 [Torulaspora globosa]QLL30823.1 hypothetical protein HG536_0A06380 [Torulaspora globosa]
MVTARDRIVEIPESPSDFISDISLLGEQLAVSCWDGSLSIYDYDTKEQKVALNTRLQHQFPLLSCCYVAGGHGRQIYVGSVQGEVLEADFELERFIPVSKNVAELGVSSMCSFREQLLCGSWDGSLQVVNCAENSVDLHWKLSDRSKILAMDLNEDRLIVATTGNKVRWFPLPLQPSDGTEVESGLKYQARKIRLTPAGDGYVTSSLDGRVAVEYFDDESRKFAFRCHRMNLVDTNMVFPVNALSFRPGTEILYTGGSDGCVSCWNLHTRKKLEQLPKFNENSVVRMECNDKVLCVATSDDSFKTSATKDEKFNLQSSRIYLVFL